MFYFEEAGGGIPVSHPCHSEPQLLLTHQKEYQANRHHARIRPEGRLRLPRSSSPRSLCLLLGTQDLPVKYSGTVVNHSFRNTQPARSTRGARASAAFRTTARTFSPTQGTSHNKSVIPTAANTAHPPSSSDATPHAPSTASRNSTDRLFQRACILRALFPSAISCTAVAYSASSAAVPCAGTMESTLAQETNSASPGPQPHCHANTTGTCNMMASAPHRQLPCDTRTPNRHMPRYFRQTRRSSLSPGVSPNICVVRIPLQMKPVCLVTGNAHKIAEFASMAGGVDWISHSLDVPELQGSPEQVAAAKCRAAAALYGGRLQRMTCRCALQPSTTSSQGRT
uniref:HAM1 protein n=1 Tax=Spironucleus salmonicida TaxID=348837 RepID=V6M5H8_9EUKA|eukprot:EST48619.1 HAM1 protein [Spironucleus salmonicida]